MLLRLRTLKGLLSDERAQAMPEFALVAPLLFLILFGMVDFGRAINYWIDETHLANEAARYAAVNANPGSGSGQTLQEWIRHQVDTGELLNGSSSVTSPARVCISFPNGTSAAGDPVEVTVHSQYSWMPILNLAPVTIEGSSTMRLEANATQYSAGCST